MNHPQHASQIQQDQIDLIDILRILWKRRKLIVGGTILATIVAVAVSLLLPKVYEVSAIFEPGKIKSEKNGDAVFIVTPDSLKESILGEAYDHKIRTALNVESKDYPKIKVAIPKGTSLVKIAVETSKPLLAADILKNLINLVDEEINTKLDFEKKDVNNQIKTALLKNIRVQEMVALTKNQIDETNKKIKLLENSKAKALSTSTEGAMPVLLYSNEIQDQQIYLNGLQEKLKNYEEEFKGADIRIDSLQLQLNKLKGMNIIKPVTVSDKPVRPKKALIAVLTFMSSLFATIVFVYILHYIDVLKTNK